MDFAVDVPSACLVASVTATAPQLSHGYDEVLEVGLAVNWLDPVFYELDTSVTRCIVINCYPGVKFPDS